MSNTIEDLLRDLSGLPETLLFIPVALFCIALLVCFFYYQCNRRKEEASKKSSERKDEPSSSNNDGQLSPASSVDEMSSLPPGFERFMFMYWNIRLSSLANNGTNSDDEEESIQMNEPTNGYRATGEPVEELLVFEPLFRPGSVNNSSNRQVDRLRRSVSEGFNRRRVLRRRYSLPAYPTISGVDESEEFENNADEAGVEDANLQ